MPAAYVTDLVDAFRRHGDRPAIGCGTRVLTFGHALDEVWRLARALRELGVARTTGLACVTGNRPETLLVRLAAHVLGARLTQVVIEPATHDLAHVLADCRPALVVADTPVPGTGARRVGLDDLMRTARDLPADPVPVAAREEDIARVTYTSGTTGPPKGVVSTFAALRVRAGWTRRHEGVEPVFVSVTSLAQRAGGRCLEHLLGGGRAEILDPFDPPAFAAVCARLAPATTYLLPPMLYRLQDHPATAGGVPGLVSVSYGGSRIVPARLREALRVYGTEFRQGYGTNESAVICRLTPADHADALGGKPRLLASAGRPVPGVRVSVRDEDGRELPPGRSGEVWTRSPAMMAGYWHRPDLDARVWRDGWLRTGDVGRRDEDGYLYLVDRIKDMIIVGGDNIYCGPVEDALARHPAVAQAVVVGRESAVTGEEIHAFLRPVAGQEPSDRVADEACRLVVDALAEAHRPAVVHWVDHIPVAASGKPDKRRLRAMAEARSQSRADRAPGPAAPPRTGGAGRGSGHI
ncbi:class I adenylate-forming enzyme family protein [Streptomyces naphthomycinicus]|uniref:class I adenylate-forming enzyme family protein n=1 Tax=Streptomyces naphthomycinicus TaxID=2872625 RepID=UPI001CED71AD|nr:AMP-binding protein [Streptomyces sp. TML10]